MADDIVQCNQLLQVINMRWRRRHKTRLVEEVQDIIAPVCDSNVVNFGTDSGCLEVQDSVAAPITLSLITVTSLHADCI